MKFKENCHDPILATDTVTVDANWLRPRVVVLTLSGLQEHVSVQGAAPLRFVRRNTLLLHATPSWPIGLIVPQNSACRWSEKAQAPKPARV
jgi:hypothetical protein